MASRDDKKLLEDARRRFRACVDADQDNRKLAIDDIKFLHEPGCQWDAAIKTERGTRPCYEFNKLRVTVKRIVNDIRANRPQGKVRAVEDADRATAAVMEGLCRNIWNVSDADAAVDTAAELQVGGGMGAWRVRTKYSTDDAWEQDIVIEPVRNPFSVWADPSARDPMKRDARYWFVESKLATDVYEDRYGKKSAVDWDGSSFDDEQEWQDEEAVRICEYWYKKPVSKKIALLSDGSSVDAAEVTEEALAGRQVMRVRDVQTWQICMAIISGDKVLEGPVEWAGTKFPFIVAYGEHLIVDGKIKWFGLTRFAKDAQRSYNFSRTFAVEAVGLAPQANKFWATPKQAEGNTANWARAHKENLPYLLVNPDPQAPGWPNQMVGGVIPPAIVQEIAISSEDIKAVTGIYDASLGQRSNETTGVAIRARQQQGEISTFNYSDNIARAIRYTWELLIDLIPAIYDAPRMVRVIGTDGAETYARVNSIDPTTGQVLNDLSRGKYDVTVTVGPSFSTQRQEAAEVYMGLAQANPAVFGVAGDLIFKSLDLPYAEDIAERLKAVLPPPIQQLLAAKEQSGGQQMPPEVTAAMARVDQAMGVVQQQSQLVQQAAAEVQGEKAEADKAKSEVQVAIANLKVQEANLRTQEAQFKALVAETQARMGETQGAQDVANDREALSAQVQQALAAIQQQAAEFMTAAAGAIAQMQATVQPQVVVANEPRNKVVRVKRVNGELVGTVEET